MDAANHATESSSTPRAGTAAGTTVGTARMGTPAASAALPQVHPERSQVIDLPPRLSTLIGRDDALDTLVSWLDDSDDRLITLTGPGGVGKTRLALEAGYGAASLFARIAFVSLAAVSERRAVLPAIARALGVTAGEPGEILDHIRELLLAAPTLLILDTFEQVIDATPDIAALLEQNPQLSALVTSRTALRLPHERVFEVDILASPPDLPSTAEEALAWPAVQLFVERVQRFDPAFRLDAQTAPAVIAICRRLDGLPLAIELAAARVRIFSLAELQDRLDEQIDILGGGPRDQPEHQRTMRATIAWSYALLAASEQEAFRVLAWFDTPFSQDAGLALLRDAGLGDDDAVAALIASLVDHHLLRILPAPDGAMRYLMFLTIRVFGRELSRGLGEESRRRDAHAAWIASYAIASLPQRPDGTVAPKNLVSLDQSYPDIERALVWYEQHGQHDALLGLVIALSPYWTHRFGRAEGRRWVERALALAYPSASESMLARAELELAALCRTSRIGDPIDAIQVARQSLARYQRLHDPLGILAALNTIGVLHRAQGMLDEAKAAFEAALAQTAELDVPWWQSLVLCNLGATALWRGETRDARHRLEEALRGFRDLNDQRGIAFTLHVLALVRCAQGDARTAATLTIEGLDEARNAEALETSIDLIAAAGVVAAAGGEFAPAIRLLEGAHSLSERAMYRIERPEREVYDDWERIARRAMGPSQADPPAEEDELDTLEDLVRFARTELRPVAAGTSVPPVAATSGGFEMAGHELTVREHQVLALMAQRYTDREIAETLQISVRTVSRHVSNIFAKLGLRSRRDVPGRAPINPDRPVEP